MDQSEETFIEPFKALYLNDELSKTLPRKTMEFVHGLHTFKISWSKGVWRKVVLSSEDTMHTLHQIILEAFQFNDDHLYSFFMDGEKWSDDCIVSPWDDFGHPQAPHIQIGMVGLKPKQTFLYLFDYGDEWLFTVEVSDINSETTSMDRPYIESSKGEAPIQYPDYDDW